jgi:hypothetical protein
MVHDWGSTADQRESAASWRITRRVDADSDEVILGNQIRAVERDLCAAQAATAVASAEEALEQLSVVITEVEDELSGIQNNPNAWVDGRLYPPKADAARHVPGSPEVTRYRNKLHSTFIRSNGALRIQSLSGEVVLEKPGADGKKVFDP